MNLKQKTILVTGGAGFIGSHLVDALADSRVKVLDDFSTGSYSNLEHIDDFQVETIRGDIRDQDLLNEIIQDVDVIFHLACRGVRHSIGNPKESHEVNALGTLELLRAARRHRIERFIHVSSSEVYGTAKWAPMDEDHPCFPETVYGAAKLAGESYARAYHRTYQLPVVVVRPFNNFGPRSHFEGYSGEVIPRFCVWALNGKEPTVFGDGTQTRDFIFVNDTAFWLRKIAECDMAIGQTLNLGTGTEHSINHLAEVVYRLAGQPDLKPFYLGSRPGDVYRLSAQCQKAVDLIGFRPKTTLEKGIGQLIEYLKEKPESAAELLDQIEQQNWGATSDNTLQGVFNR